MAFAASCTMMCGVSVWNPSGIGFVIICLSFEYLDEEEDFFVRKKNPANLVPPGRLGIQREVTRAQVARQIGERQVHRTTISQNLRTPRKFFLLVLVLVLDWVSGLDYDYEDDDEDDSVAAAPLRHCIG